MDFKGWPLLDSRARTGAAAALAEYVAGADLIKESDEMRQLVQSLFGIAIIIAIAAALVASIGATAGAVQARGAGTPHYQHTYPTPGTLPPPPPLWSWGEVRR